MKKLLSILLTIALLLGLTACGEEASKSGKRRDPASGEKVTPTASPEATPTVSPETTPTPEPTPALPKVAAKEGPLYAIGADPYAFEYYSDNYTGEGAAFQNHIEYIYLLEVNYQKLADRLFKENQALAQYADGVRKDAAAFLAQSHEKFDYAWFVDSKVEVSRADSAVFSYKRSYSTYLGGAHPFSYAESFNIDTAQGTTITLSAYVKDTAELAEVVVEGIKKQGDANLLWDGWEKGVFAGVKDGTANWIATKDGVTIWYNPGDIAAYAAGSITVSVNVSDYPELFVEQYIGAYGNQQLEKVTHQLATEGLSAFYTEVLPAICDGMGTATWKDIRAILDAKGILYEGLDDDEALEYEMQPFFKLKEGKEEFYLYFFPRPDDAMRVNVLSSVDVRRDDFESFALVEDYYHTTKPQFQFVDWAIFEFPVAPAFGTLSDMLNVLFAEIYYGHNRAE